MQQATTTKLTIKSDKPTALTSSARGANVDTIGFNILFIALREPSLAVEIMRLHKEAYKIKTDDPAASGSEYMLAVNTMNELRNNPNE